MIVGGLLVLIVLVALVVLLLRLLNLVAWYQGALAMGNLLQRRTR